MNANGSGQTRLTVNPGFDNRDPAWSPDGQRIAFTSARDGNSEIYVMKADGSAQTRLTTDPARDFSAAWSPDGTRIAFASARTGAHDVYVMNADGSGQTRLTTDPASDFNPAWSPDGAKIAYESTTTFGDGGGEVLLMNADGSGRTNLTNNPEERPAARLADDPRRLCRRQGRPGGGEGVLHGDGGGVGRVHDRPTGVGGRLRDPAAPGRQAGGRHARTGRRRGRRGRRRGLRRVQGSAPDVPAAGDAADGAISLGQAGTLSKLLLDLPLKGSVTVAWADGGTSSSFDREIDVESLTQAVGKLVSLRPGESVNRARGQAQREARQRAGRRPQLTRGQDRRAQRRPVQAEGHGYARAEESAAAPGDQNGRASGPRGDGHWDEEHRGGGGNTSMRRAVPGSA